MAVRGYEFYLLMLKSHAESISETYFQHEKIIKICIPKWPCNVLFIL